MARTTTDVLVAASSLKDQAHPRSALLECLVTATPLRLMLEENGGLLEETLGDFRLQITLRTGPEAGTPEEAACANGIISQGKAGHRPRPSRAHAVFRTVPEAGTPVEAACASGILPQGKAGH
eukprot:CAMPEP_0168382120 /NCGR_PEP_ID=MMETSP0228-20121227/13227_1 /TAXON_ID=133427 /ORGANISM="Protoceratium reticulatum, Strain CCCM 535 (=CCMP 1889)" /LENGTH=122 /DNA_ID=CAMNT_0008395237 /DNA_START=31 /DNA_END=396 /DNA_ORIENTATION=-